MKKKQYCSNVMIALAGSVLIVGCGSSDVQETLVHENGSGADNQTTETGASTEDITKEESAKIRHFVCLCMCENV